MLECTADFDFSHAVRKVRMSFKVRGAKVPIYLYQLIFFLSWKMAMINIMVQSSLKIDRL